MRMGGVHVVSDEARVECPISERIQAGDLGRPAVMCWGNKENERLEFVRRSNVVTGGAVKKVLYVRSKALWS